jgi:predicted transcriptional regulator
MAKRHPSLGAGPAILDLRSYARHGPGRRDRLSSEQLALISRTVHRAPEVMVKVLNRGAKDLKTVARHLGYLSRSGKLELETDEGQKVAGKGAGKALVEDWDLGLDE